MSWLPSVADLSHEPEPVTEPMPSSFQVVQVAPLPPSVVSYERSFKPPPKPFSLKPSRLPIFSYFFHQNWGTLRKQSSGSVERTYQSRDPEGCTYQSSDPEGYTYQSGDPEGCTYQSSDPEGYTYQSSDPEGYTLSGDPEGYTYP
ncbi:NBS-LRR type resistance protein [Cucumis melo var. makuwa]|uniref:NBS-LRR type resistance protein n=1 Tax=Cucumis melo var. makuwa TaxID=1194695 RepID=A0A5A7TDV2_CUCMM|nr:NBS-LRR type resistance protein [Cucumis melo var. makuwa]